MRLNTAHNSTAHFGVTRYSDLTMDEFAAYNLNKNMSHIVGARLKSIQDKPKKNVTTSMKVTDIKYAFTDNNEYDRYPSFYKEKLLEQNLNFIPLKVDWYVAENMFVNIFWIVPDNYLFNYFSGERSTFCDQFNCRVNVAPAMRTVLLR